MMIVRIKSFLANGIKPLWLFLLIALGQNVWAAEAKLDPVAVAKDQRGFVLTPSGRPFTPWGFNYDHDRAGRLLEDYWQNEWASVAEDFREMKELGANVVRVHLQFGKFMDAPAKPNAPALAQLAKLAALAEQTGLYLDLTGLGCYHKQDVPAWYDALGEKERWQAQAAFWEAVSKQGAASPAVFCYDLMNEPVVAGAPRKAGDWLGPAFAGKHFVQFITLDATGRAPPGVAGDWIRTLKSAIRKHDRNHLVTVGLVDWSLDRPGLRSGFVPEKIAPDLDFLCVHIYPEKGKMPQALETLRAFAVGKPVAIEETFPLRCPAPEFALFLNHSHTIASGWMGFYWGKTPAELRSSGEIADALILGWLEFFQREARIVLAQSPSLSAAGHQTQYLEGWTVLVNEKLLAEQKAQTERALELLQVQLKTIAAVVPWPALGRLRAVPLWFSPMYAGIRPRAEYHPDVGWLRANGRNPAMAKAVEFTNVGIFAQETKRMPLFVLHELAHAYHDQVLGFNHPEIKAAYRQAVESKSYDAVERHNGRIERAYAMTDAKEYFAENTEAFFGQNDFFPFSAAELERHDPTMFRLLQRLWQTSETAQTAK